MSISSTNNNGPSTLGIVGSATIGAIAGKTYNSYKIGQSPETKKTLTELQTYSKDLYAAHESFYKAQLKKTSELKEVFIGNGKLSLLEKIKIKFSSNAKFVENNLFAYQQLRTGIMPFVKSLAKHVGIGAAAATGVYIAAKAIFAKKPQEIEE